MNIKSVGFFWLIISASVFASEAYGDFDVWLQTPDTWIRVGVKEPEKVLELYSMNTLLVLDGRRVLGTIQPHGEFRVLLDEPAASKTAYWVQLRAQKSPNDLEQEQVSLQNRFTDLAFAVMPSKDLFALRSGPYSSRDRAERVKRLLKGQNYSDAFVVTLRSERTFYWVNDEFDKFPLNATDLAFVSSKPNDPIQFKGTGYRGILRFRPESGKLRVINELPMEVYLRGVVPSELGPQVFPEVEALKAQAVAARTYAIKNMGRFNRKGYDICDSPACQAYEGTKNEHEMSDMAVYQTKGMVLYHENELIDALYTSTCGGQTDDVENVFPGRSEPYLRSKTSYLANFSRWPLPPRPCDYLERSLEEQDVIARAMLYGVTEIRDLERPFSGEQLSLALEDLAWIFGKSPGSREKGALSHKAFWSVLGQLEIIQETIAQQIHPSELEKLGREYPLSPEFLKLAAFLLRFEILAGATPQRLELETPIQTLEALGYLVTLAEAFGPEPEWRRYRVSGLSGNQLTMTRGSGSRSLDLGRIRHYLTEVDGKYAFRDKPEVEQSDNIYVVEPPFPGLFLRLHEASTVSSVDRFSVFDSWVEKKSVEDLEKRARRYVSQIRGLKDVRILERSPTGRVTLLEFVADNGTFKVDGLRIRWSLGIRENLFTMLPSYQNGRMVHVTFFGRGWGHGIGMSQVGAYGLAQMGWTYDQILKHYYQGVRLVPYGTDLSVPAAN